MATVTPTSPAVPTTITNLAAATVPLNNGDLFVVVQNGVTKRVAANQAILPGQLNTVSAGNGIAVSQTSGIATVSLATLPSANILLGNAINVATAVPVTGDVTLSNAGVTAIAANAVTNAKLAQAGAGTFLSNITAATANVADNRIPATAGCQLQATGASTVTLMPKNGNQIIFPSGYIYTILSTGLASGSINGGCNLNGTPSSTLSANTLYYCYLWYNSGTPALDFSTTGHLTDSATGIEIKNTDTTRVLVGMIYPQSGPVVTDSTVARLVASWFNRQNKYFTNSFSTNRTTTSATPVEVNTEIRGLFLTWGDTFTASYAGVVINSAAAATVTTSICIDGISTVIATSGPAEPSGIYNMNAACTGFYATTEGEHYLTIAGSTSGSTATWLSATSQLQGNIFI